METLGKRVKSARDELGYSQKKLGQLVNVTQQNIAKIERDKAKGTYLIAPLAKVLMVNADWLLTGQGPMRPTSGDDVVDQMIKDDPIAFVTANRLFDKLSTLTEPQLSAIENLVDAFSPSQSSQ